MDQLIYKYFAGNGGLYLQNVGRFRLEHEAAESDISTRKLNPPKTLTRFYNEPVSEDYQLVKYIARHYVITDEEARKKLQSYTQSIIDEVQARGSANVSILGTLQKKPGEGYSFTSGVIPAYLQAVDAERPVRQDDVHLIRVGEDEKTNIEMADILSQTPGRTWKWWIIPVIAGVLVLAYLAWYLLVQHGSLGSQQKIRVQ